MEEHTFNSSVDAALSAEQPHFDDQRTLLTARPVVPLAKIDAKERHLRRWFLGGAFALAMLLGAASALIASYLKLRNVPDTAIEVSEQVETPVAPVAVVPEVNASELPVVENTEEEAEPLEEPVTPKRAPVVRRAAERNTDLVRPRVVRPTDEDDELQRIRESVLIDAWEERRARRALRRERRNRVDHHDRDLSNLDEIFEGPRRRRRQPS